MSRRGRQARHGTAFGLPTPGSAPRLLCVFFLVRTARCTVLRAGSLVLRAEGAVGPPIS